MKVRQTASVTTRSLARSAAACHVSSTRRLSGDDGDAAVSCRETPYLSQNSPLSRILCSTRDEAFSPFASVFASSALWVLAVGHMPAGWGEGRKQPELPTCKPKSDLLQPSCYERNTGRDFLPQANLDLLCLSTAAQKAAADRREVELFDNLRSPNGEMTLHIEIDIKIITGLMLKDPLLQGFREVRMIAHI